MKEYVEKLYTKLHEAMEKPVTLGSAEEVGLYAKTICRLEKLHGHHDEPEAATFDRETAMQWAANMQNADGTTGPHWTMEQTTAVAESKSSCVIFLSFLISIIFSPIFICLPPLAILLLTFMLDG